MRKTSDSPELASPRFEANYTVRMGDNFHYGEPAYVSARFDLCTDAIAYCRKVVEDSLDQLREPEQSPAALLMRYRLFGDDPYIIARRGEPEADFSAWAYAEQLTSQQTAP